jgi:glycosyltransferase involved in cell wall biosynthesis
VALFADCFHEVNGVALTCRQLAAFAERRGLAYMTLHGGPATRLSRRGPTATFEFRRGPLAVALDADFHFDPLFPRYRGAAANAVRDFGAEVVHVTGPGDTGILGAAVAHGLGLPLVASWHTNVHEYGARRLERAAARLPGPLRRGLAAAAGRLGLEVAMGFYRRASLILAPNPELIALLRARTGKSVLPMRRGVDTELFSPARRTQGGPFTCGYVGRLTAEKNLRLLPGLEQSLIRAGAPEFRFVIVGQGSEKEWLAARMRRARFTGVLRGEDLARAYADMDAFVFPSETDTFGNVIQEAMASGVPCVVSGSGGPRFLVESAQAGMVCPRPADFTAALLRLMRDPGLRRRMGENARAFARAASWDQVCGEVHQAYQRAASMTPPRGRRRPLRGAPQRAAWQGER